MSIPNIRPSDYPASYLHSPTRSWSSTQISSSPPSSGQASSRNTRPLLSVIPGPLFRSSSHVGLVSRMTDSPLASPSSAGGSRPASPGPLRRARTPEDFMALSPTAEEDRSRRTRQLPGQFSPKSAKAIFGNQRMAHHPRRSDSAQPPLIHTSVASSPRYAQSKSDPTSPMSGFMDDSMAYADHPHNATAKGRRDPFSRRGGSLPEFGAKARADAGGSGTSMGMVGWDSEDMVLEAYKDGWELPRDATSPSSAADPFDQADHTGTTRMETDGTKDRSMPVASGRMSDRGVGKSLQHSPSIRSTVYRDNAENMNEIEMDVGGDLNTGNPPGHQITSRPWQAWMESPIATAKTRSRDEVNERSERHRRHEGLGIDPAAEQSRHDANLRRLSHRHRQHATSRPTSTPPVPPSQPSSTQAAPPSTRSEPAFAYNASSKEEEVQRAGLAAACEGLSSLCSQYHGSAYSRMKYGDRGAPVAYCPLTIVAPQHVAQIMAAQAIYESQLFASSDDSLSSVASSSYTTATEASVDSVNLLTPSSSMLCSSLEWLGPKILEDGTPYDDVNRSGFSDQENHSAERIRAREQARVTPAKVGSMSVVEPQSLLEEEGLAGTAVDLTKGSDSKPGAAEERITIELREAMAAAMIPAGLAAVEARDATAFPIGSALAQMTSSAIPTNDTSTAKTSTSHPINISALLPPSILPSLPLLLDVGPAFGVSRCRDNAKPLMLSASDEILPRVLNDTPGRPLPYQNMEAVQGARMGSGIGNMLLSSCPGKKVRLGGPVKGRGAICRDISSDLQRIKGMGVGCIVCCLDDDELRFLGVPWEDYRAAAIEAGLSVVRIPMPEGLTPASLTTFDAHLEKVLRKFTLKGINVLAHCRGGVGRAGLTACAWAIKLGIVGQSPAIEEQLRGLAVQDQNTSPEHPGLTKAERENARVMSTVERVITLARSRRSVKAIETFEQVNFLASYVAWLRKESGVAVADELESMVAGR